MSVERELLKKCLGTFQTINVWDHCLIKEIIELLVQPEPEQEPLSDKTIAELWGELAIYRLYENAEYLGFLAYKKGIKDAEKAHDIGVRNE